MDILYQLKVSSSKLQEPIALLLRESQCQWERIVVAIIIELIPSISLRGVKRPVCVQTRTGRRRINFLLD